MSKVLSDFLELEHPLLLALNMVDVAGYLGVKSNDSKRSQVPLLYVR